MWLVGWGLGIFDVRVTGQQARFGYPTRVVRSLAERASASRTAEERSRRIFAGGKEIVSKSSTALALWTCAVSAFAQTTAKMNWFRDAKFGEAIYGAGPTAFGGELILPSGGAPPSREGCLSGQSSCPRSVNLIGMWRVQRLDQITL
jgi:hypothetical protein